MIFISKSVSNTEKLAGQFLETIFKSCNSETATIVGLHGNLGSGKTAFTKCVAKLLGVNETVTSPTFVIMKRFITHDSRFTNLIHIDAYRLESGEELLKIGWKEIIKDPKNLILIEWPENVDEVMPRNYLHINFEFIDEMTRKIEFDF